MDTNTTLALVATIRTLKAQYRDLCHLTYTDDPARVALLKAIRQAEYRLFYSE